jgi:ATP-dependent Clp protease ATP-binding subunit ClpC
VVLFDEIEKAHPQIFNLFLQTLEDGQLTDATGKTVNFRNTIIIMTSNLGMENFNQATVMGFQSDSAETLQGARQEYEEIRNKIHKSLKDKFRPEFLNRIDTIAVFQPLTKKEVIAIARLQLKQLKDRLGRQGINLTIGNGVSQIIAKRSYSPEQGARAVRKTIHEQIENQIAEKMLRRKTRQLKVQSNRGALLVS